MKKPRNQISVGLGQGRQERLRAISSQHPFLKHLPSPGVVIAWMLDWAVERLWGDIHPVRIQKVLADALGLPGFPWSRASDRLAGFASEALIDEERLGEILDGRPPTDDELSAIAMALNTEIEPLRSIVQKQYEGVASDGNAVPGTTQGSQREGVPERAD